MERCASARERVRPAIENCVDLPFVIVDLIASLYNPIPDGAWSIPLTFNLFSPTTSVFDAVAGVILCARCSRTVVELAEYDLLTQKFRRVKISTGMPESVEMSTTFMTTDELRISARDSKDYLFSSYCFELRSGKVSVKEFGVMLGNRVLFTADHRWLVFDPSVALAEIREGWETVWVDGSTATDFACIDCCLDDVGNLWMLRCHSSRRAAARFECASRLNSKTFDTTSVVEGNLFSFHISRNSRVARADTHMLVSEGACLAAIPFAKLRELPVAHFGLARDSSVVAADATPSPSMSSLSCLIQ